MKGRPYGFNLWRLLSCRERARSAGIYFCRKCAVFAGVAVFVGVVFGKQFSPDVSAEISEQNSDLGRKPRNSCGLRRFFSSCLTISIMLYCWRVMFFLA